MTLNLRPEIEASLYQMAEAQGVSIEEFLETLVSNELPRHTANPPSPGDVEPKTGTVMENGILVYRTGNPLPASVIDEAIQRSREDRIAHVFGEHG